MSQMSRISLRPGGRSIVMEDEHFVTRLIAFVPAGEQHDGKPVPADTVRFVARNGGIRTVRAADLIVL